jgi:DNA-binding NtrC family response regulator/pSer/pThr/pTyr-binding forkhead associated (FHA) protein
MHASLIAEAGTAIPAIRDLQKGEIVSLGRNSRNAVVLDDRYASKRHAEVYNDGGTWWIRDCASTNGTRVNGKRITDPMPLSDGAIIAIGDVTLRFLLRPLDSTDEFPAAPALMTPPPALISPSDAGKTLLQMDDLTALLAFTTEAQQQTTPHALVRRALAAVCRQVPATQAGYVSFDVEDPDLKILHPPGSSVDSQLSRQLTQRVQKDAKLLWLQNDRGQGLDSESLLRYNDALCIPLHRGPGGPKESLGALHVYRAEGAFTDRHVRFCETLAGYLAAQLHALRARRALEADILRLREHASGSESDLVGDSAAMKALRQQIGRLAVVSSPILICGESGVGKELVAVSLHREGRRSDGPFVTVNCAALPGMLVEAELFGHKAGAFTGATADRTGMFVRADEGTLFLDEIGELPLEAQAKLLRALEQRTVTPVGGIEVKVDVHIVAATNRDLKKEVHEGRFRKDLFFRLGTTILVPPLREHQEDIPQLVEHFLDRLALEYHRRPTLTEAALRCLCEYDWPGNVRQLRSVLDTAVAMSDSGPLDVADLRLLEDASDPSDLPRSLHLDDVEAWAIRKALAQAQGNRSQAARTLGMHRDTLLAKMKKYGIE